MVEKIKKIVRAYLFPLILTLAALVFWAFYSDENLWWWFFVVLIILIFHYVIYFRRRKEKRREKMPE